jgi:hypothetical protein
MRELLLKMVRLMVTNKQQQKILKKMLAKRKRL